jgi:uncharacterized protein with PQ loop repeat
MLPQSEIGNITLNISSVCYFIFYLPQILHNLAYKKVDHLSMWMQFILCIATMADLLYGFGRGMPWQYRAVTIVGLISLAIQQWQICWYSHRSHLKMTLLLGTLLALSIYCVVHKNLNMTALMLAGMLAQLGGMVYALPQIMKNFAIRTSDGLSFYFIVLGILLDACDSISAWTLNWDFPSKIGSPLAIAFSLVLLGQFFAYRTRIGWI